MERKKRIKSRFKTFCHYTSMHGFLELFYSASIFWVVFWCALLTTAVGMTVYQISRAVNQYLYQASTTSVLPAYDNDMYPPIKLCYTHWISWLDLDKALSLNFSKHSILFGMSYLSEVYTTDWFNATETEEQFRAMMNYNNFTTMQQFYEAIAKNISASNSWAEINFSRPKMYYSEYWGAILCYYITSDDVKNVVTNKNKNYIDVSVIDQNYSSISDFIDFDEQNAYASHVLNPPYYAIKNGDDTDFSGFVFPQLLYPDGYSQNYILMEDQADFFTIFVGVTVYRSLSTMRSPCLEEKKRVSSNLDVYDYCNIKYPVPVCKCKCELLLENILLTKNDTPENLCRNKIKFVSRNTTVKEDNSMDVPEKLVDNSCCVENETDKELRKICFDSTLVPCEKWTYSFTTTIERFSGSVRRYVDKKQTGFRIIYPMESDILIFVETGRQTWEDFVGNIGGLLGVWTGASLLSIVQLIYLCCFSRTQTHSEESEENSTEAKKNVFHKNTVFVGNFNAEEKSAE